MPKRDEPGSSSNRTMPKKELSYFIRSYWIEIAAVLVVLIGVLFFILERSHIVNLLDWLRNSFAQATTTIGNFVTSRFSPGDLIGITLGVLGMIFILWRIRVRLDNSTARRQYQCPRCGGELRRIHRSWLDRLFTTLFFTHGRRYQCSNNECAWTGILHKGVHNRMRETSKKIT